MTCSLLTACIHLRGQKKSTKFGCVFCLQLKNKSNQRGKTLEKLLDKLSTVLIFQIPFEYSGSPLAGKS